MTIRKAHLIVYVRDPGRATAFWRAVLQREPSLDAPGMTEFEVQGGLVLGLMPESGITGLLGVDPSRNPDARTELYLLVDDPGRWHERALAAGAEEASPLLARDWGHEVAYSLAPDGVVLAFARSMWDPIARRQAT